MQVPIDSVTAVVEITRSAMAPADRRAVAVAVLEAEREAMEVGAIHATPRSLAEVKVCLETIAGCDDEHVDTTLAAIYEVRFVAPED